jgi:hypothetical protein
MAALMCRTVEGSARGTGSSHRTIDTSWAELPANAARSSRAIPIREACGTRQRRYCKPRFSIHIGARGQHSFGTAWPSGQTGDKGAPTLTPTLRQPVQVAQILHSKTGLSQERSFFTNYRSRGVCGCSQGSAQQMHEPILAHGGLSPGGTALGRVSCPAC